MSAVEFAIRSSLVLAVALAALWSLRRQPAALRHWLLAAALLLAAAQPLINRVVPQLPISNAHWPSDEIPAGLGTVTTDVAFEIPLSVNAASGPSWRLLAYRIWIAGAIFSLGVLLSGVAWLTWLGFRARDAA